MALADYLEKRTLIAAINDPNLAAPKQFLLSNFFGSVEETGQDTFDLYRLKGDRRLASFRAQGAQSKAVRRRGEEFLGTYKFPHTSESIVITPDDLRKLRTYQDLYRTNAMSLQEREAKLVSDDLAQLKGRVERREEWMAAQLLTTGKVIYDGEGVAFTIDFGIDTTYLPTLSSTSRWGQSAADIPGNLRTWTRLINAATGGYGGRVILGSNATSLFLSDSTVRTDLGTINVDAGRIILNATQAPGSEQLGKYNGFTFETYEESYEDDAGDTQSYFPANGALLIGSTFKGRRLYGANWVLDGGYADAFYADQDTKKDPDEIWIRGMSRPMPIAEEEGSWLYATVA